MDDFDKIKSTIIIDATNIIAAEKIADMDFPKNNVFPRMYPYPFQNLSKEYLFDIEKYFLILFQSREQIKNNLNKVPPENKVPAVFAIFSGTIFILAFFVPFFLVILFIFFGMGACMFFYSKYVSDSESYKQSINKKTLEEKIKIMEQLLLNKWEVDANITLPEDIKTLISKIATDVDIHSKKIPISFIFDNSRTFIGYGQTVVDSSIICAYKNEDTIKTNTNELFDALFDDLKKVNNNHIKVGKIVVLDTQSIPIDSPWLLEDFVPCDFVDDENMKKIDEIDKRVSVRKYIVVEVLFPEYESSVCFFVSPLEMNDILMCRLLITTMGPPRVNKFEIKKKISLLQSKINTKKNDYPEMGVNNLSKKEILSLRNNHFSLEIPAEIFKSEDIEILKKKPISTNIEYIKKEIMDLASVWPGAYTFMKYTNRERLSSNIGGNALTTPNIISFIKIKYELIFKQVLAVFDKKGIDVSSYKDKDGKVTINAENIDKIIVGEVVNVSKETLKEPSSEHLNTKVEK